MILDGELVDPLLEPLDLALVRLGLGQQHLDHVLRLLESHALHASILFRLLRRWLLYGLRSYDIKKILRCGHHRLIAMVDGPICLEGCFAL